MRTYDIINAGPKNRFMANGRIVSNSGSLLQPQNLVKPTKEVDSKMDRALELLKAADYDTINKEFSSALDVASAALRPILRAKPGFKLAIADLNAIESRGAAWISDCDSLAEVFRNGRDPYCAFAALLDPTRTYEDFYHEWKVLGKKTNRTNAKPATLGCFGKYTEVITDKGIKKITDVSSKDKVWDGEEWVSTEGCAYRGEKQVINLMGVEITPEHEILVDEDWREAWELYQNIPLENRAINLASGKLLEANLEKILGEKESSIIFANAPKDFLQNKLFRSSLIAGVSTFDLINCGARNRFTILTDRGPLIVHNCAYGLSGGEITEDDEGNEVKSGLLGYADSMGIELEPEFAQKCVDIFRNAYPEIPATWYSLQDAFARVVEQNTIEEVNHVTMRMKGKVLCITLPSGRDLHYINPRTHQEERKSRRGNMYKATVISYEGINQKTRQWERVTTWGGKIFENIVQAVCRDILAYGMLEADREGFSIVLHVHDEIVAEVPETGKLGYEKLVECMCRVPFWCPGFLIGAEGFENSFYKKES